MNPQKQLIITAHHFTTGDERKLAELISTKEPGGDERTRLEARTRNVWVILLADLYEKESRAETAPEPRAVPAPRTIISHVLSYRRSLQDAYESSEGDKEISWQHAFWHADRLVKRYGPATFARIDEIAYRYV